MTGSVDRDPVVVVTLAADSGLAAGLAAADARLAAAAAAGLAAAEC